MQLDEQIKTYLRHPVPIWNVTLAKALIHWKWYDLATKPLVKDISEYNTANLLLNAYFPTPELEEIRPGVFVEAPDFERLTTFYREHDLHLISLNDQRKINATSQLRNAFDFLGLDNICQKSIITLTKRIHVLTQPEPEFDVSYSHPDIPFTIFVSIGDGQSENDVIRLAESILHEGMHLKLTLIEHLIPMISDNSYFFFSPWRDEERPTRGVLHGMFVFRAILDFYISIQSSIKNSEHYEFIDSRIEMIKSELNCLNGFELNKGLSANGAILARNLLPLN